MRFWAVSASGRSAPNQVLVAGATADLAGDAFRLEKLGERKLTGRKTETRVYTLDVE
jgi:class 3 adenylate cyclase